MTGRVISIAADPTDLSGNTVYLGTAGGGVWKSTNATAAAAQVQFVPLTDALPVYAAAPLASLSIGALSVQPNGSGVILAGTGDPNASMDAWYGAGILRSTDNGSTWSLIALTPPAAGSGVSYNFVGNAFAGFAWGGVGVSVVVAAVTQSIYGTVLGVANSSSILGLYYSLDAGATWQLATLQDGTSVVQSSQINVTGGNAATAVVWNAVRQRFYAAVRHHGYYDSPDGITWTRLQNQPGVDLTPAMCPVNAASAGSPACPIARGALAVQSETGDLFALTVDQNNIDQGLWRDTCAVTASGECSSPIVQFASQITDAPLHAGSVDGSIPSADYSLWLAAVPAQQDTLLLAGTADIWRCSLANSCSWRNTTNTETCAAAQVAPAQHAVDDSFGSAGLLFFGNDGGLWRTTSAVDQQQPPCSGTDAAAFDNLNSGLGSLAEIEDFSQAPENPNSFAVALGALGTAAPSLNGPGWIQVENGEGDTVAIDPSNSQNWYATSSFGVGINRCTQGASCTPTTFASPVIGAVQVENDAQLIPAPWILDPQDPANLILATCRIWRGPADGTGWSSANLLSGMLDGSQAASCNGDAEIRTLAAAPITAGAAASQEQIYAGMAGALDGGYLEAGHVFTAAVRSTAQVGDLRWIDLYGSPVTNSGGTTQFNPGGFDISSIYIDPHDPTAQTIYLTIQGFSSSGFNEPLLYHSTDGGAHWNDITSNLPRVPANSVTVDPGDSGIVYVATDSGVYITSNAASCVAPTSACWSLFGSGLPNAPVTGLQTYTQGATQSLRAATFGRGLWQTALATAGVIQTTAVAAPTSLGFGQQQVESVSTAQVVTLSNTGNTSLLVSGVSAPAGFSETNDCVGQLVLPGASCSISARFAPIQTGPVQGQLMVDANVSSGQLTVPLTGTGTAPSAVILTPPLIDFGAVVLGAAAAPQVVTVANTGGSPVTLSSESASGDFSLFSNSCGAALAFESSCSLGIVFKPSTSGPRTGILTISDSAGTQMAQLSGQGQVAATDSLSTTVLDFPAQQVGTTSGAEQVTMNNSGDAPLSGILVSVTGDFLLVNNCGPLLPGHTTCTLLVSYAPTRTGSEAGTLTILDPIRTQSIAITGTGLLPPGLSAIPAAVSFGGTAIGTTSSPQAVTVTNAGQVAVSGLVVAITSGFAIAANNCPSLLNPGAACQIGVTFSPATAGAENGALTIRASNVPQPMAVALSGAGEDFSIAVVGSPSAVMTSGQSAIFSLQLAGVAGSSGTVLLSCSGLPKNAACSFNPAIIGVSGANSSSATVTVATGVSTSAERTRAFGWKRAMVLACMIGPLLWPGRRRARSRIAALLLLILLIGGCGVSASSGSSGSGGSAGGTGGGGSENATPTGTYTVTITGAMSNAIHSTTVQIAVQ